MEYGSKFVILTMATSHMQRPVHPGRLGARTASTQQQQRRQNQQGLEYGRPRYLLQDDKAGAGLIVDGLMPHVVEPDTVDIRTETAPDGVCESCIRYLTGPALAKGC
jgi:hypothetical protein